MKKILSVDDHAEVKKLLEIVLQKDGRQFFQAENGEEAIRLARQVKPDVILLDIMMPGGMDGYDVMRILRADPETSSCVIIAMTAKVQQQDRADAFAAGADDYLPKPFNMIDLKQKVEHFLND